MDSLDRKRSSDAQQYYDVLRRIASGYSPSENVLKSAETLNGCEPIEALEMAYDNIQNEARNAIRGKRRPKQ